MDYAKEIRMGIERTLYLNEDFYGKDCILHVTFLKTGQVSKNLRAEGYAPLCQAAVKAVRKADIPAVRDRKYKACPRQIVLDIKPIE
ncbi:cell envelope integrity protein TolA [Martelella alba]|uniref:TonB C-terminal domain-containing protein n=1 Tax=Martelella alba TaxID=2590451 RepID=A0ABY2SJ90_9HYPH|nr:cell envelope integrity protein TolA [Martelella alba]TKI05529.1 hypothetical protein FCN80_14245 [Martelella alba]